MNSKKQKLIVAIIIAIIIIGIVVYKKFIEVPGNVAGERAIEELLQQVYYEDAEKCLEDIFVSNENIEDPLPEFSDINEAPEEWIWMVLYNNLENEENLFTYEQIQEKLISLFSENLNKKFPEEGVKGLIEKNLESGNYYKIENINNSAKKYGYSIKTLTQEDTTYRINILQYEISADLNQEEQTMIEKEIKIEVEDVGKAKIISVHKKISKE
ncbi:MAG: hypothetical protein ACI4UE_03765 [Candidatus Scatovivens sp.]